LRLKDGETQVLAGLISDEERENSSRLPGIGDIPLLGRLFSNQLDRKNKTEIVLAITPKVISNINLPNADVSEHWSGTENLISDKPSLKIQYKDESITDQDLKSLPIAERIKIQMRLNQEKRNSQQERAVPPQEVPTEQPITVPSQTEVEQSQTPNTETSPANSN
jgi:general secretion pathway protein D